MSYESVLEIISATGIRQSAIAFEDVNIIKADCVRRRSPNFTKRALEHKQTLKMNVAVAKAMATEGGEYRIRTCVSLTAQGFSKPSLWTTQPTLQIKNVV